MAQLTLTPIGGMWAENRDALDMVAAALNGRGHDAAVVEPDDDDLDIPRPDLVVRFVSVEDGRGLARAGNHLLLALKRSRVGIPERVAIFDHTGRLLNDTAPWLTS